MDSVAINQVVCPLAQLAELELQHPAVAESLMRTGPRSSSRYPSGKPPVVV